MNVLSVHFVKQLFGQTYRANIIRNVSEEDFPFFGNISYKLFLFSTFTTNEHPPNTKVDEKTWTRFFIWLSLAIIQRVVIFYNRYGVIGV